MSGKVHHAGKGDRLVVESGGVLTVEAGGRLVVEAGGQVTDMPRWLTFPNAAHTIADVDAGADIETTSAGPVTITVLAGVRLSSCCRVHQFGNGQVSFAEGAGVTIHKPASLSLSLAERYAVAILNPTPRPDEYYLSGYLEASP